MPVRNTCVAGIVDRNELAGRARCAPQYSPDAASPILQVSFTPRPSSFSVAFRPASGGDEDSYRRPLPSALNLNGSRWIDLAGC
jgi:hypothetical protein